MASHYGLEIHVYTYVCASEETIYNEKKDTLTVAGYRFLPAQKHKTGRKDIKIVLYLQIKHYKMMRLGKNCNIFVNLSTTTPVSMRRKSGRTPNGDVRNGRVMVAKATLLTHDRTRDINLYHDSISTLSLLLRDSP